MGRHVAANLPELDRTVDNACTEIGREIESLALPAVAGVVLGGGYGRGEGGVKGECSLSNDLDFFVITENDAAEGKDVPRIAAALEPISRKWTQKLGIDVDFTVRTPWRIRHDQERIMVQELVRGYFDVAGAKGEALFADIERREPSELPWMEAARLLMNRGMGLLLAKCKIENAKGKAGGLSDADCQLSDEDRDFVSRNINKCILGAGDALLVARGAYAWKALERAERLGDRLYSKALEWKFRPANSPVCDWETAREEWLGAKTGVFAAVDDVGFRRTLRSAARWVARRRTLGEVATFGMDPVVRILACVSRCVAARSSIPPALLRDWEIFN